MANDVELDHDRRIRFAKDFLARAVKAKSESNAFGDVELVLKFKDGLVAEVEVSDRTTYR